MTENIFYLMICLSACSFSIGFAYRFKIEKEIRNKSFNSNRIERLDALEFAYYFLGIVFLLFAFGLSSTLFN